jgi:hypothetical protein
MKKYDLLREYYKIRLDYQSNEIAEFDNIDGRITFSRSTELGLMIIDSLLMLLSLSFFILLFPPSGSDRICSFYCIRTALGLGLFLSLATFVCRCAPIPPSPISTSLLRQSFKTYDMR